MQVAYIVCAVLFGYLAYREAGSYQRRNGRAPWGWEPLVWAFVVGILGILFGGILFLIARRTTKPSVSSA